MSHVPTCYDRTFFDGQVEGSLRSARVVAPIVLELARVRSVVDLGCGRGAWLRAFHDLGVDEVLGLDGPYLDPSALLIRPWEFRTWDLSKAVELHRRFDLAICVEVAEHLPTRSSGALVRSLASLAPLVLFSAAIPGQEGTRHVNEQWPEFWDRHFARSGLTRLDAIRPRIAGSESVEWWYRQNLALYATPEARASLNFSEPLGPVLEPIAGDVLARYKTARGLAGELARAIARAIKNRILGR
jgi:SAM-dependent methyltransferase